MEGAPCTMADTPATLNTRRTKIVATLGPSSTHLIGDFIKEGVNAFRFDFSRLAYLDKNRSLEAEVTALVDAVRQASAPGSATKSDGGNPEEARGATTAGVSIIGSLSRHHVFSSNAFTSLSGPVYLEPDERIILRIFGSSGLPDVELHHGCVKIIATTCTQIKDHLLKGDCTISFRDSSVKLFIESALCTSGVVLDEEGNLGCTDEHKDEFICRAITGGHLGINISDAENLLDADLKALEVASAATSDYPASMVVRHDRRREIEMVWNARMDYVATSLSHSLEEIEILNKIFDELHDRDERERHRGVGTCRVCGGGYQEKRARTPPPTMTQILNKSDSGIFFPCNQEFDEEEEEEALMIVAGKKDRWWDQAAGYLLLHDTELQLAKEEPKDECDQCPTGGMEGIVMDRDGRLMECSWRPGILAKIDTKWSVDHIDDILPHVDGIIVARGNLGSEVPVKHIPVLQKRLIKKARAEGKLVIVATELLKTMMHSPNPTRAEVNDVANAVFDDTDCVLLSAETSTGEYPLECIRVTHSICLDAEQEAACRGTVPPHTHTSDFGLAIARAATTAAAAEEPHVSAFIVFSVSGAMTTSMSSLRPKIPILSFTPIDSARTKLSLFWGVTSFSLSVLRNFFKIQHEQGHRSSRGTTISAELVDIKPSTDMILASVENALIKAGILRVGDHIIMCAGANSAWPGLSYTMRLGHAGYMSTVRMGIRSD
ncbi:hypothetical protein HK102_004305 [Quaeritorhiza haematococci]|nr:hypothetical protein HK102_004305 [Quaeritorhiza haematococci]